MQIARHDSDALVLESRGDASQRTLRIFIASTMLVCDLGCLLFVATQFSVLSGILIMGLLAFSLLGLFGPILFCWAIPYGGCVAFAGGSRQILVIRKYVLRTTREELDFDQVRDVLVERVQAQGNQPPSSEAKLLLADGRKIGLGIGSAKAAVPADRQHECEALAVTVRQFLGPAPSNAATEAGERELPPPVLSLPS